MDEFAAITNKPTDASHPEQYAAASVGVSRATRESWASLRADKNSGVLKPNVVERVITLSNGDDPLMYNPARGGWIDSGQGKLATGTATTREAFRSASRTWAGPNRYDTANRNVRTPDQARAEAQERAALERRAALDPVWGRKALGRF